MASCCGVSGMKGGLKGLSPSNAVRNFFLSAPHQTVSPLRRGGNCFGNSTGLWSFNLKAYLCTMAQTVLPTD